VTLITAWMRLELKRRWRSLAALALLVALSTGTVLTAVAGARRGETSFARLWARSSPATATLLANKPHFAWNKVRDLPEVAAIGLFPVSGYNIVGYPVATENSQFPLANSQWLRTIEHPVVLQGRLVNPRRVDEVDVTGLFPRYYHKGVGSRLTIRLASPQQIDQGHNPYDGYPALGPKIRVRIVGVVRSPWFADSVGSRGGVILSPAVFARYRANIIGSHGDTFVNALVRLKGGQAAIPRLHADLVRLFPKLDIQIWNNLVVFGVPLERDLDYEAACLLAFGLAALAAAIFLVGQSVARYSAACVTDLQVLRASGITPREASAAAAAGPFLAGLAGATLGVVAAIVASGWMPIGAASLEEPSPGVSADWPILIGGWVAALLLVLAGSLISAALTLASARGQRPERRSVLAAAAVGAGAPVPVLVGTRFALEPGRGRSALPVRPALVGAVAGVLGVMAAYTFSAGVADAATNPARFGQTFQLESLFGENGHDLGPVAPVLRKIAASRAVTGLEDARSQVAQSGQISITTYSYQPVGGKRMPVVLTAGRMPAGTGQIVLAPTTAKDLNATVGSVIRLQGGPQPLTARVTGIGFVPNGPHNSYDSGAWVTGPGFTQLFAGAQYTFQFHGAMVVLRQGVSVAAGARLLSKLAASVKGGGGIAFSLPQLPEQVVEVRDVAVLPFALGGFLVLLAIGAVGHALMTAVRRRRHELAVLRALGITRVQSRLIVVTQASVLAVVGLVFGVPLGVVLGRSAWRLVADSTPLAYHAPLAVLALVLTAPAALVVANLLAAWPGQRAARLRSAVILRAE
jgi:FtsX-like permease family